MIVAYREELDHVAARDASAHAGHVADPPVLPLCMGRIQQQPATTVNMRMCAGLVDDGSGQHIRRGDFITMGSTE